MVGKRPSTSQNSSTRLAAQAAEEFGRDGAGHAVAAVEHDLQRARRLDVADDAVEVGGAHVGAAQLPAP